MSISNKNEIIYYVLLIIIILVLAYSSAIPYYNKSAAEQYQDTNQQRKLSSENSGIKIGGNPYSISINPNNDIIYVVDKFYKRVSFIDGNTDRVIKTITIPNNKSPYFNKYMIPDISSTIAVDQQSNLVYVANSGSDIVSIIDGSEGNIVLNNTIDGSPRALGIYANSSDVYVLTNNVILSPDFLFENRIYSILGFFNRVENFTTDPINQAIVTAMAVNPNNGSIYAIDSQNFDGDTLYVINQQRFMAANNITNYPAYNNNFGIAINPTNNKVYVNIANVTGTNGSVLVIDGKSIKYDSIDIEDEIKIKGRPFGIAVNPNTNLVYVVNSELNTVNIIEGTTNKIIKNVTVGSQPRYVAINPRTNLVYVTNFGSGTVSVINGTTKNDNYITAGLTLRVNPLNSGIITCNDQKITKNYTRLNNGTLLKCQAQPNSGFQFSSWSSDFNLSTPPIISTIFDFINYALFQTKHYYAINNLNDDTLNNNNIPLTTFIISKYGTLSANFINSSSIPPEFWAPLYGLIPGFFIPSAISWLNGIRQRRHFGKYLDKIGTLDKETIGKIITDSYREGKINESHYNILKEKISERYKDKTIS